MPSLPRSVQLACGFCGLVVLGAAGLGVAAPELGWLARLLALLGLLALGLATFRWGARLGYAIQGQSLARQCTHLARCAAMTVILFGASAFVGTTLAVLLFGPSRHH